MMDVSSFSLEGKVALVTGSTKGIGYGIAMGLANAGADLVIVSRHQADCDRVAEEVRSRLCDAIGIATDITKKDQLEALITKTIAQYGRIDILVNNAGTAITKKAEDLTEEDFDRVVNLDQRAVFTMSHAVGKVMIKQGGGKIINIASILGLVGDRQVLPYCVAKGGVIQMTKALALEWAKYNIRVNAICPGYVITPMNEADLKNEKIYNHIIKSIPMRRLGQVEDISGAAVYLASDASNYMTGQHLVIDGGWTAQ
ncbi:SDR family NAD(P)-dependent oxidoreductase [Pelotomaculum propionicicum]|uniref:SDR family NAD(P)-dependent oxidoreductase n=1 Tax=Pelotomaculum propionicicum TaxID=258475 RepID=UPI003B795805